MSLPRVRIIGDSISMGYLETVRDLLADIADVSRPEGNCESTLEGVARLGEWLEPGPWDIIQFNWGLHDLKYMVPGGNSLANPQAADSVQKVPPEAYRRNLAELTRRLAETGARLIWCSTTPVPAGAQGRIAGDEETYNRIACGIIDGLDIGLINLHAFAHPRLGEIQQPENVHFTDHGSRLLGDYIAGELKRHINSLNPPEP